MIREKIQQNFLQSIEVQNKTLESAIDEIVIAAKQLEQALLNGNKILICGNGGSAADAQHFSSELTNRFVNERPALPAIALTTDSSALTSIANDYSYQKVFSRQLQALGQSGDVLVVLTTSGNSLSIIDAVKQAQERDLKIIVLSGKDGGDLANILRANDVEIRVPSHQTARIQETHIVIIHSLCDLIDHLLFGISS